MKKAYLISKLLLEQHDCTYLMSIPPARYIYRWRLLELVTSKGLIIMVQCLDISNVMLILSYLFDRKNASIFIFFYYKLKRNTYGIVLSLKATVIIYRYIIHYYSANWTLKLSHVDYRDCYLIDITFQKSK